VVGSSTGDLLASYTLATGTGETLINDVVLTRDAAFFTDSRRAALYRVPLGVADRSEVRTLPLGRE